MSGRHTEGVCRDELQVLPEDPEGETGSCLLKRYFEELGSRFPEGFDPGRGHDIPNSAFKAPTGAFLVAYLSNQAVGCGALRYLSREVAEVKRMWVEPTRRGCGVGRRLLSELEAVASGHGCRLVRLDTSSHLGEALALYRSSGYREIDAYNDNPYAAHWFERSLR